MTRSRPSTLSIQHVLRKHNNNWRKPDPTTNRQAKKDSPASPSQESSNQHGEPSSKPAKHTSKAPTKKCTRPLTTTARTANSPSRPQQSPSSRSIGTRSEERRPRKEG